MLNPEENVELPEKQKQILAFLLKKPYRQKDLAEALNISGAGLLYHLNLLEKDKLIQKVKLYEVGNVTVNEISLNPNKVQHVRAITNQPTGNFTLITGFGKDSEIGVSSTIPATVKGLLEREGYRITKLVAFVAPDSNIENARRLVNIDKIINKEYIEYRNENSELMHDLERLIREEQSAADLILDLTPLTKLLTIKLLEISYKYHIPSFYLGKTKEGKDYPLWIFR